MMSSHGVAIVMHSFDTSETTDAASRSEFASRRRTFQRDGLDFAGCFTPNFAASQLRSPRPRQRCSCALFPVLALVDAIATAR
jgi:glycerophosphoryl diester phosphodiesterase